MSADGVDITPRVGGLLNDEGDALPPGAAWINKPPARSLHVCDASADETTA